MNTSNLLREISEDTKNGFSKNINESDLKNLLNIDKLIKDNVFVIKQKTVRQLFIKTVKRLKQKK